MRQSKLPRQEPRNILKEVWRCQRSTNVDEQWIMTAIDDSVISSVKAATRNEYPLANWDEYNGVEAL